ncbi:Uncharacterised protein [uncultured archaeon]|nr:Uncharacterised protein [uncultured archaeon]
MGEFIDMLVSEFTPEITTNRIREILANDFHITYENLTPKKAVGLLEKKSKKISSLRESIEYFHSEKNHEYRKLLEEIKFLRMYLQEADPRVMAYQHGITRGVKYGADTTVKFVPHVVGSAIGAFMGGLRGEALQSTAGKVNVTDLENELENVDIGSQLGRKKFIDEQMTEHFKEFVDPTQRDSIYKFIDSLITSSTKGRNYTPDQVAQMIQGIPGNPFKGVTDQAERKKLADFFYACYIGGKKSKTKKDVQKNQNLGKVSTDVISALVNLGYKQPDATRAVQAVLQKTPNLKDNFDDLLKASNSLGRNK